MSALAGNLPEVTLKSQGAVGDGIADDLLAFERAASLSNVKIRADPGANYMLSKAVDIRGQRQCWDMRGATVTTAETANPLWWDRSQADGVTLKRGLWIVGGEYIGTGQNNGSGLKAMLFLRQWADVRLVGCKIHDFAYGGAEFENCPGTWLLGNIIYNVGILGGANAINWRDYPPAGSLLAYDFHALYNTIGWPVITPGGVANAGIGVPFQYGGNPAVGAEVAFNKIATQTYGAVACEVNAYNSGAGETKMGQIGIHHNWLSSVTDAIFIQQDAAPFYTADPYVLADFLINHNFMIAAGDSSHGVLHAMLSRSKIASNLIRVTGTQGTALWLLPNALADTTVYTDVDVELNTLIQDNPASTGNIADNGNGILQGVANARFAGNTVRGNFPRLTTSRWAEISGSKGDILANPGASLQATGNTAGASPFTVAAVPFDRQLIITATNGMTAMSYSRNGIALPTAAGTQVTVRRNETVTMTWAGSAPTYALIPMP